MYPPKHHTDRRLKQIYRVVRAYPFATLISATGGSVQVTQTPLLLDSDRGAQGVLIGHIDAGNPQVSDLENGTLTALFHGPNSYISPRDYGTRQLPTWNYITVHAKGEGRILEDPNAIKEMLMRLARENETAPDPFELSANDERMARLLPYITAFEIEVTEWIGRFKLSQDKSPIDRENAKQKLVAQYRKHHEPLINYLLNSTTDHTAK